MHTCNGQRGALAIRLLILPPVLPGISRTSLNPCTRPHCPEGSPAVVPEHTHLSATTTAAHPGRPHFSNITRHAVQLLAAPQYSCVHNLTCFQASAAAATAAVAVAALE
eukprot:246639-Chlamydomonas_euryale.AAC.2